MMKKAPKIGVIKAQRGTVRQHPAIWDVKPARRPKGVKRHPAVYKSANKVLKAQARARRRSITPNPVTKRITRS